jgi:hypothetical protein
MDNGLKKKRKKGIMTPFEAYPGTFHEGLKLTVIHNQDSLYDLRLSQR